MTEWNTNMDEAPRDGTRILAIVGDSVPHSFGNLTGRVFQIRHEGTAPPDYDLGWAVYPGLGGAPDDWFDAWQPTPPPPEPQS